jgi:hypothetical protein
MLTSEPAYITDTSFSVVVAFNSLILDINNVKNISSKKTTEKIIALGINTVVLLNTVILLNIQKYSLSYV